MLKTCLSPTDGTRTNTLPSGYEMSRQVINCDVQVRIGEVSKGLQKTPLMRWRCPVVDHSGWTWKRKLTLIWSTEAPSAPARDVKKPSMGKAPDDGGHSSGGAPPLGSDC